jgi:hypothetical protein
MSTDNEFDTCFDVCFDTGDAFSDPDVEVLSVSEMRSIPPSKRPSVMPSVVETPTGMEVVPQATWDEATRTYDLKELQLLLAAASPHQHQTLRSTPAMRA